MKKIVFAALAVAVVFGMSSCGDKKATDKANESENADSVAVTPAVTTDFGEGFTPTINVRYLDQTRFMQEYNLAKDLHDLIVKNESDLQQYQQNRMAEIQKFATEVETKYRNGGYLSQTSLEADQKKLQQMQANAEAGFAKKQQEYQQQVEQQTYNIQVNLQNFLIEYNKEHHYDAILYQSAGAYFNPSLDITDEIVEGLNKIYNQYHE